jgi:ABC-type branched-subunit amino acid transport system substrate-binding protein
MVSCNEANHAGAPGVSVLQRAGTHLISNLRVPAIVGPYSSQDTIELSNTMSVQAGTLLVAPNAIASSIADLADNDLTWQLAPSDGQRGPLLIRQINQLEEEIRVSRGKQLVRLAIAYRNDAVGMGTFRSLANLTFNGKPLNDPVNAGPGGFVLIDEYNLAADQNALVNRYLTLAPDIIVIAGGVEGVTQLLNPLEQQWDSDGGSARPYYVLNEDMKSPDLIAAATNLPMYLPTLRGRMQGTGFLPSPRSVSAMSNFQSAYVQRYGSLPSESEVSLSFDAAYAIAYALVATRDMPVSGAAIAQGMRKLSGGVYHLDVGATNITASLSTLGDGHNIALFGTFARIEWNDRGATADGIVDVWCVTMPWPQQLSYKSAGLTYDVKTGSYSGMYQPCSP